MADYVRRESKALTLGVRFHALIPRSIVEDTDIGTAAVAASARAAGITRYEFMDRFGVPVTSPGFARGVLEILTAPSVDTVSYVVPGEARAACRRQPFGRRVWSHGMIALCAPMCDR